MKKVYEKPNVIETMPIEEVLMDEEFAQGWANWNNGWNNGWNNWHNSWNNSGAFPQTPEKPAEGGEK